MTAIWVRLRAELRSRWRSWLALALLAGIAGGIVMAAAAAARRTDSAYPRFIRAQRAVDVAVIDRNPTALFSSLGLVEKLPEVADFERFDLFLAGIRTDEGLAVPILDSPLAATERGRLGWDLHKPKILKGRRPSRDRADEVSVGFLTAERFGLDIGSRLFVRLAVRSGEQLLEFQKVVEGSRDAWDFAAGPTVTLRVVGIEATPGGFPPLAPGQGPPLFLTPAFHDAYAVPSLTAAGSAIILKDESALEDFRRAAQEIMGPGQATFLTKPEHVSKIQRSVQLQVVAFWLIAGLIGFAAAVMISQALARQVFAEAGDYRTLAAIGMRRRQLWALAVGRAALMCGPATLSAGVVALLLSPATPIGLARIAEPDPGFQIDFPTVGIGGGVLVLTILGATAVSGWWAARAGAGTGSPSRQHTNRPLTALGSVLMLLRPPAVVLAGVRMALQPRGGAQYAVPVRSTITCASAGVAALVAALCFGTSLQHLVRTPELYGRRWDARVGSRALRDVSDEVVPRLRGNQAISEISEGTITEANIAGSAVGVLALDALSGAPFPVAIQGRAPESSDEILLGSRTFRAAQARIGETIDVRMGGASKRMRVVGRGVHPDIGDAGRFGEGAAMTYQALKALNPHAARNVFVVRFAPGADHDRTYRELQVTFSRIGLARGGPPTELAGFGRVANLPLLLAMSVALVGVGTMVHTLLTAVHRRRRDLAVLKTLGFVRRQVGWAVVWQATVLAVIILLIGLPIGLIGGGRAWAMFAGRLGVRPEAVLPVSAVFLIVPSTLLVANLVAAVPARMAAATHPGAELSTE